MGRLTNIKPRVRMLADRVKPAPKKTDPLYLSKPWKALVAYLRRVRGDQCQVEGCEGAGRIGDHIVEIRDGGAPLDPSNVQLMCFKHHQQKTARERQRRARGQT